jgi:CPA2 family monovalent cation:H+ antiporter-2
VALGVALGASALLGLSLALGAFVAGLVVGESDLSHQAAADAVPLRDAFAVLFFLSVGMLFDPSFLLTAPGKVLAVLALIMVGTPAAAFLMVSVLGYPLRTALTVAAGLAQIGEFSFIVAAQGRALGMLPEAGYQLILSAALLSITLNPLVFRRIDPVEEWLRRRPRVISLLEGRAARTARLLAAREGSKFRDHAIICGYGRVGSLVGRLLERQGIPYVIIEQNQRLVEELRRRGVAAFYGDAANEALLAHVNPARARVLVIAIPDPQATRLLVEYARRRNPDLEIIARTHSESEWIYLRERVTEAVLGEREAALEMARYTLSRFGVGDREIQEVVADLRASVELGRPEGPPPAPEERR